MKFRYLWLDKKQMGVIRRYIRQLLGYSFPQMDRLIEQYKKTGHIRRRQRTVKDFETKYTKADIRLIAEVDRIVDNVSGTTVKAFYQRALEVFGDQRFVRLAGISVSHIYNLRKSKVYQRCRCKFTKTKGIKVKSENAANLVPMALPAIYGWIRCIRAIWMARKAFITSMQWTR